MPRLKSFREPDERYSVLRVFIYVFLGFGIVASLVGIGLKGYGILSLFLIDRAEPVRFAERLCADVRVCKPDCGLAISGGVIAFATGHPH